MNATHAAVLTRINRETRTGSEDTLAIIPIGELGNWVDAEPVDTVFVDSAEDDGPYIAAVTAAGWTVVDRNGPSTGVVGASALLLVRAEA